MHICLVYPGYPPETHSGGIGTYVVEVAKAFSKARQYVSIISRSESPSDSEEFISSNVFLYRLGDRAIGSHSTFRNGGHKHHYQRVCDKVKEINLVRSIDIIETCDWGAEGVDLLTTNFGKRMVVRCHTPSFISEQYNFQNGFYLSSEIKEREKELLMRAQDVVSPSYSLAKIINDTLAVPLEIRIEPYLLDTKPIPSKRSYVLHNHFSILTVGRIEERKGQDIIIKAVEIMKNHNIPVRLHMIGQDTVSSSGVSMGKIFLDLVNDTTQKMITFGGVLSRQKVLCSYKKYDVYVAASRFDNFPFTVLEAMAAGLPVVGNSMAGGIREQINDGHNGLLFDGSATHLANRLESLFAEKGLRYKLGVNAKRYVKKAHNPRLVIERMLNNYHSLCTTSHI